MQECEGTYIDAPVGKESTHDKASRDLVLAVQDDDECLAALLDRRIDWFNNPAAYSHPSLRPIDANKVAMIKPAVCALAKVLF